MTHQMKIYPDCVIVAGGGRWARVIITVLCALLPKSVRVMIYSPHCAEHMTKWAQEKGLHNVFCSSKWPDLSLGQKQVMIVANAARDHFIVAKKALQDRVSVLVEKPVTLSFSDTQELVNISKANNVHFVPAHVFLFASYLDHFSEYIHGEKIIKQIKICWSDPKVEYLYGEAKYFDPSLPIYADLLPHILSILSKLIDVEPCECKKVYFSRGGAKLIISLSLGDIPCLVELIRNGDFRTRLVSVETESGLHRLEFSSEPGTIFKGHDPVLGEKVKWDESDRPLARMLSTFLKCSVNASMLKDRRLDIKLGLLACKVSDQIEIEYKKQQRNHLLQALGRFDLTDEDLRYSLGEILQLNGIISSEEMNEKLESLREVFTSEEGNCWFEKFLKTDDYGRLIRKLAVRRGIE